MKLIWWILFGLFFFLPQVNWALSPYDLIQLSRAGYSDEQIIELIKVTDSRFHLDAESLVKLKEADLSETLIQALIEANSTGPPSSPSHDQTRVSETTDTSGDNGTHANHGHAPEADEVTIKPKPSNSLSASSVQTRDSSSTPLNLPSLGSIIQGNPFSYYAFEEPGSGHGNSHRHYALSVSGLLILILRSEAGHHTIADRAREITELLNLVVKSQPDGSFFTRSDPNPAIWYQPKDSNPPLPILTVERGDVIAYQRRSLTQVSKDRLAAYWAALLNDYTRLFVFKSAPMELVGLHLGEILTRIYTELNSRNQGGTKTPSDEIMSVSQILDHLAVEEKEHLLELATRVPAEFQIKKRVSP